MKIERGYKCFLRIRPSASMNSNLEASQRSDSRHRSPLSSRKYISIKIPSVENKREKKMISTKKQFAQKPVDKSFSIILR